MPAARRRGAANLEAAPLDRVLANDEIGRPRTCFYTRLGRFASPTTFIGPMVYYIASPSPLTWQSAVTWCSSIGAELVSLPTQASKEALMDRPLAPRARSSALGERW